MQKSLSLRSQWYVDKEIPLYYLGSTMATSLHHAPNLAYVFGLPDNRRNSESPLKKHLVNNARPFEKLEELDAKKRLLKKDKNLSL